MSRTIRSTACSIGQPQTVEAPLTALAEQAAQLNNAILLAYAEDGVIWGTLAGGVLKTAHEASPDLGAALRPETLLELRLFNSQKEWHAWTTPTGWQALTVSDGSGASMEFYDEALLLWGTDPAGAAVGGFYPVQEADLGIRHAPPKPLNGRHSLRLVLRHYLTTDDQGAVQVQISRLVALQNGGER